MPATCRTFMCRPNGKLTVEILNTLVSLDAERALLDDDGSALVIHAGPDDYKSDPAGHAGDRIACGILAKPYTRPLIERFLSWVPLCSSPG